MAIHHTKKTTLDEPVSETYNLFTALGIIVTTSVTPIASNHFPPFTMM